MKVPFLDLQGQHARIRDELDAAVRDVIDHAAFIGGRHVSDFEHSLGRFQERKHAKGVSSCTAALTMTLRGLGIGPGDEVITTPHTAMPTPESITLAGGEVVFADIEPGGFQLDPDQVEAAITPRTRAVLLVHLYGLAARIERFVDIARRHDLALVEDIAQAQGARFAGRRLGTFGNAGCLSFFPSKNLGGFGDSGAVITDDDALNRFVSMYSNHGRLEKYTHDIEGANERLDGLQAAVLSVKLKRLDEWNARRRQVAAWYAQDLTGVEGLVLPMPLADSEPVWHLYVVRVADRDGLAQQLKQDGIGTGRHYPLALHQQPAYARLGHGPGSFPHAEAAAAECLSLPMDPFMAREQVARVAERIRVHLAASQAPVV